MLHLHRIGADDKFAEILYACHGSAGLALKGSFAPPNQSLIGFKFDEDVRTVRIRRERNAKHLHVCYAQICIDILEWVVRALTACTLSEKRIAAAWISFNRDRFPRRIQRLRRCEGCSGSGSTEKMSPVHAIRFLSQSFVST